MELHHKKLRVTLHRWCPESYVSDRPQEVKPFFLQESNKADKDRDTKVRRKKKKEERNNRRQTFE